MHPNDNSTTSNSSPSMPGHGQGSASLPKPHKSPGSYSSVEPAAELIRQKIDNLYAQEPNAAAEAVEAAEATRRSKHQEFMYTLTNSGKSLAEIQTRWHEYYSGLPDEQKHQVWQEFYAANDQSSRLSQPPQPVRQQESTPKLSHPSAIEPYMEEPLPKPGHKKTKTKQAAHSRHSKPHTKSVADIKKQLLGSVKSRRKLKAHEHLQSLIFGLGVGSAVLLMLLFGFFNERFIAPFITPSQHVSSTPIIIDPNSTAVSQNPEVLIPKINVEIPVVYGQTSIEENDVQKSLEQGVVHYATTPLPGEKGNTVLFGHSSNNIFNPGKYKFAFVLLSRLENGDLFYLTRGGKQYVYKVYKKEIVEPTNVSVLNPTEKPATATLITCDPPGTSLRRLVVVGEQITPDPAGNAASTTAVSTQSPPKTLPSASPSLWERFTGWLGD